MLCRLRCVDCVQRGGVQPGGWQVLQHRGNGKPSLGLILCDSRRTVGSPPSN